MIEDPHSEVEFGHIGPGTAAFRMHRLWEMMDEYEDLMIRYVDFSPVSSKGLYEDSFMELFKLLLHFAEHDGNVIRSTVLSAIAEVKENHAAR